jgi:hypothetical protein
MKTMRSRYVLPRPPRSTSHIITPPDFLFEAERPLPPAFSSHFKPLRHHSSSSFSWPPTSAAFTNLLVATMAL